MRRWSSRGRWRRGEEEEEEDEAQEDDAISGKWIRGCGSEVGGGMWAAS